MSVVYHPSQLVGLVKDKRPGQPVNVVTAKQQMWRQAETNTCAAVEGLFLVNQDFFLPDGFELKSISSPIVPIGEALEAYGQIAPGYMNAGLLEPKLIRLMVVNDYGTPIQRLRALWGFVRDLAAFEQLRPKDGQGSPNVYGDGQDTFGNALLYVDRVRVLPQSVELMTEELNSIPLDGTVACDVLRQRELNPVAWQTAYASC